MYFQTMKQSLECCGGDIYNRSRIGQKLDIHITTNIYNKNYITKILPSVWSTSGQSFYLVYFFDLGKIFQSGPLKNVNIKIDPRNLC